MLIKEFRIVLPMSVEEYQIGQRWSVAETSRHETGGGEGVQIFENRPFEDEPLLGNEYSSGQYTRKKYFFANKVNGFVRALAPKAALVLDEFAWNAYPYCKTVVRNEYLGDNFVLTLLTHHLDGPPTEENVHRLSPAELAKREVVIVDIADKCSKSDYSKDEDPCLFHSEKTGRGPLEKGWIDTTKPVMTCYKLVHFQFKKFGLQSLVEKKVMNYEERLFMKFHRQVFVWIDQWHGLTIKDVEDFEDEIQQTLEKQRVLGSLRGGTFGD